MCYEKPQNLKIISKKTTTTRHGRAALTITLNQSVAKGTIKTLHTECTSICRNKPAVLSIYTLWHSGHTLVNIENDQK